MAESHTLPEGGLLIVTLPDQGAVGPLRSHYFDPRAAQGKIRDVPRMRQDLQDSDQAPSCQSWTGYGLLQGKVGAEKGCAAGMQVSAT